MPDDPRPEGTPGPAPEQSAPASSPQPPEAPPPAAKPAAPAAKPAAPAAPKAPAVMAVTPWEGELPSALKQEFGEKISELCTYAGQSFLVADPDSVIPIIGSLKDNHGFDYLVDVTAVHWPQRPEQFDVIYILYSFSRNERIRIKTRIQEGYKPLSATTVHLTANWLEREVYDMFGIEFEGHPDLKRILMPDEWTGHPLRKDKSILDMDQRWVRENLGIESGQ